jgi:phosphonate transport system substrate-binding protein
VDKRIFKIVLLFLFCLNLEAEETLTFAPLPTEDRKTIFNYFYPMVSYLEKELDKEIKFVYYDNYEDIVSNFKAGKIDFAYLGPLPYVQLKKEFDKALALVHFKNEKGESTYTCSLVRTLWNKKRQKIALTQPLSTCGYLSVNALLDKKLKNYKYQYLGRHDLVALEVLNGNFDMGGLKSDIAKGYFHLGLDEIAVTKPFPMFSLIINSQSFSSQEIQNITNVLLYINQEELNKWGKPIRYGAVKATDEDFNPLREMLKNIQIPLEGNF